MEFWGVEVKHSVPLHVDPGEDMIVHISQAALGENKNNVNEPIRIYLKVGEQKLIIGTLSHEKFPQLNTEIVLERDFELSHSWKNGSVFFSGYKVDASDSDAENTSDDAVASDQGAKQVNFQLPNDDVNAEQGNSDDTSEESEDDSDDSDDDSDENAGGEEEKKVTAEVDSDEDDEDDSSDDDEEDSSDEETPKKPEETKKRTAEATTSKNPASNKKAKFVTPQKTETKKPHVHVATPHPSKQAGKNSGGSNGEASKQQQTPKSAGAFGCKSCSRTFTSEMGLQSHTKAKHSAAA